MKLSDLVNWNPWWKGLVSAYESWYKYYNFSFIAFKGDLDFSKNYIIRGPRQVGKTYFLFKMMNNAVNNNVASFQGVIYISCDRLGGRNELRNLIRNLKEYKRGVEKEKILFLDEVTAIEKWERVYKEICEEGFFKVIATGSRPKELEEKGEYFPGRNVEIYNFYPLSFKEFVYSFLLSEREREIMVAGLNLVRTDKIFNGLRKFLDKNKISLSWEVSNNLKEIIKNEMGIIDKVRNLANYFEIINFLFRFYLETGGYPIAIEKKINEEEIPYELVVQDTLGTIEKEGLNIEILNRLIPKLIERLSSPVSYSDLAKDLEVEKNTLIKYLETLERSFIIRVFYYYDGKVHPKKNKKIYFCDPFMIKAFEKYYSLKETDESIIVENIVGEHLARNIEDPFRVNWKNRIGYGKIKNKEVDFLVKEEEQIVKIEVKYQENPVVEIKDIDFLLTKDNFGLSEKPYQIPASLFLLTLK